MPESVGLETRPLTSAKHGKRQKSNRRKLRHIDYWSALLQARSLGEERIEIYPCAVSGGLHLGHDRIRYRAHSDREGRAKAASLRLKIRRVIDEHREIIQRLQMQLEEVITVYDVL